MFEVTLTYVIGFILLAFVCEYVDSTLGMGYGTTLTPLLLIMGYNPLQVVPVVLISELISGLLAGMLHHKEGNVNLRAKKYQPQRIGEHEEIFFSHGLSFWTISRRFHRPAFLLVISPQKSTGVFLRAYY